MFGPPVFECYKCNRSYLTTNVMLYTCEGVKRGQKIALQCKECSLIYNPTQFGNKHVLGSGNKLGFQFYFQQQAVVEITDPVYFERNFLEW